jgi:hypothetical protein
MTIEDLIAANQRRLSRELPLLFPPHSTQSTFISRLLFPPTRLFPLDFIVDPKGTVEEEGEDDQ